MNRRDFIFKSFVLTAVGGVSGISLLKMFSPSEHIYFRPPGALAESDFLAACIRCGKCVQACPYNTLLLADLDDGENSGTPYINFRQTPCYMCEDLPCIQACPTDALDHDLKNVFDSCMGTAVITDREACLSLNGIRCEICYRVCPLIDKAITIKKSPQTMTGKHTIFEPIIHKDICTGCGICENACPLDQAVIKILPSERGDKAQHYQFLREQIS